MLGTILLDLDTFHRQIGDDGDDDDGDDGDGDDGDDDDDGDGDGDGGELNLYCSAKLPSTPPPSWPSSPTPLTGDILTSSSSEGILTSSSAAADCHRCHQELDNPECIRPTIFGHLWKSLSSLTTKGITAYHRLSSSSS